MTHTRSRNGLAQNGLAKIGFGQKPKWPNQDGQNWIGQSRSLPVPPTTSQGCEGSGDVVGVLTLLVGGIAQAFHDDRVVELRVQLGVEEVEGKDREEQVEVEREKRVKEGAP